MNRGDALPGEWHCKTCQYTGSGWTWVGYQDNMKGGVFALASCPHCHSTVNPK